MDIQQAVAENIHRIRKAQRLSIDRAAELSGVSKSMWGQIERGGANPTVSVLSRMAQGLHVPLEQLIACHDDPPTMLHRAVDVTGQRLCGGKVIAYRLFPFDPESRSESVQLDLFISGSYDGPDRVPGSWIYVTSLSGTVEVTTGVSGDDYIEIVSVLQEGDTVAYIPTSSSSSEMGMMGGMPGGMGGGMPSGGGGMGGGPGF